MEVGKFDHSKDSLDEAMGMNPESIEKIKSWGGRTSKDLAMGKINKLEVAERIVKELTDLEILFLAVAFVQKQTDGAIDNIPPQILKMIKKMEKLGGNVGVIKLSKGDNPFDFDPKDAEKNIPLSQRKNKSNGEE